MELRLRLVARDLDGSSFRSRAEANALSGLFWRAGHDLTSHVRNDQGRVSVLIDIADVAVVESDPNSGLYRLKAITETTGRQMKR